MTLDGHIIKIILWWITFFLNPRQPILRKVQMEKHTLPTGPMDFLMGPNTLKYLFLKIIQRVFILDILTTYDSHLNKIAAS